MTLMIMRIKNIFFGIAMPVSALMAAAGIFLLLAGRVWSDADVRRDFASKINDRMNERVIGNRSAALFSSRSADIERIRSFFINRDQPVAFVENLERAATKSGAIVTFDLDEANSTPHDLLFRLTVGGSQESVIRYLELLETMPYLMHGEEITFEKAAPGNAGGTVGFGPLGRPSDARALVTIRVQTL